MKDVTLMSCPTTHKKFREIRDIFGEMPFSVFVPIFQPIPFKIQAPPPYEIHVFRMSKTLEILCNIYEKISSKLTILW